MYAIRSYYAIQGQVHAGGNGIAGEFGHNPLPWIDEEEWAYQNATPCVITSYSIHYTKLYDDLGTSSLKVVLLDQNEKLKDSVSMPLTVSHPHSGWSEQDPHQWWQALEQAMLQLKTQHPTAMRQVQAIGFSGQMHGATLLDEEGEVLRPCT